MPSDATVMVAVFLLFLGVFSIALAVFLGYNSPRAQKARVGAMAVVGVGALVAMVYVLHVYSWQVVWDEIIMPLLLIGAAALGGVLMGAGLIYLLVAAR